MIWGEYQLNIALYVKVTFNNESRVLIHRHATDVCFSGFNRKDKKYHVILYAILRGNYRKRCSETVMI